MSAATSPAPWSVNNSGGAMTIVARDRSVVAIVMGNGSASPFETSNAHLLAAAPDLRDALRDLNAEIERLHVKEGGTALGMIYLRTFCVAARTALAKAVGS